MINRMRSGIIFVYYLSNFDHGCTKVPPTAGDKHTRGRGNYNKVVGRMNEHLQAYQPFWGSWYIESLIGEGSFGTVYRIRREDFGRTYYCAMKHISIPRNEAELKQAYGEGMDGYGVQRYFAQIANEIYQEVEMMARLKGTSNIVSYEDHMIVERQLSFGWDIFIRMELLTSLNDHLTRVPLTRDDVVQLGVDICSALELCQRYNIIHRDIKPDNIFISEAGSYKLGDFGIARQAERNMSGFSKKGTYMYMAPEIYKGEAYNASVDSYSLGLVMYRLLNDNRLPFMPPYPADVTVNDREQAMMQRMSGEYLPPPVHAAGRLADTILRACAYDPGQRFVAPAVMRQELELARQESPNFTLPNISGGSVAHTGHSAGSGGHISTPGSAFSYGSASPSPQQEAPAAAADVAAQQPADATVAISSSGRQGDASPFMQGSASPVPATAQPAAGQPADAGKKKSRKKPLAIAISAVALLLVGAIVVWIILGGNGGVAVSSSISQVISSSAPAPTSSSDQLTEGDYVVEWADTVFEQMVREALNKPTGDILRSELSQLLIHDESMAEEKLLYIKGNHIVTDLTLEYELENGPLHNLEDLKHFTDMQFFRLYYNPVCNPTQVAQYASHIQGLRTDYEGLEDLSFLAELPNLERLYLHGIRYCNVWTMPSLPNLKSLALNQTGSDTANILSFLDKSQFPQLLSLYIWNSFRDEDVDLEPLRKVPTLKTLILLYCNVSDLSPLESLVHLEHLTLESNPVDGSPLDISVLGKLTSLTSLTLQTMDEVGCEALANLQNLRELSVAAPVHAELLQHVINNLTLDKFTFWGTTLAYVGDISISVNLLAQMPAAEIKIHGTNWSDFTPILQNTSITRLSLPSNEITNWEQFKEAQHLTYLDLSNNRDLTESQISLLREALPNCEIVFERSW